MHIPRREGKKTGNTELHKGQARRGSLTKVAEIIVHTGGIIMLILDLHVLFPRVHEMGFLEWHLVSVQSMCILEFMVVYICISRHDVQ